MLKKIVGSPLIQIACLCLLVLAGMLAPAGPWAFLENKHFDFWSDFFRSPGDKQPVAIIAVDRPSLDRFGDWPWPRSRLVEMVRLLTAQGADALGISLLYTQPYQSPGLLEIKALKDRIGAPDWPGGKKAGRIVMGMLDNAEDRLDHDTHLLNAVRRARNVVLPLQFSVGGPPPGQGATLSGLVIINSLNAQELPLEKDTHLLTTSTVTGDEPPEPLSAGGIRQTYDALAGKAGAMGHLNFSQDRDGVVRRMPLLIEYQGRLVPAFALQLARKYLDVPLRDLSLELDFFGRPRLRVGHLQLSTDRTYRMLLSYDESWTRERTFSFAEVLEGQVDPAVFRNKIVLIGLTALEVTPSFRIGSHTGISPVEISANALGRILSPVRLSRPSWVSVLEGMALLYFAFFLVFVIPRVSFRLGAVIFVVFLLTWYAAAVGLLLGYGYWIKFIGPVLLACLGFALIQSTIYFRRLQLEKVDADKALGVFYQSQGMLDMAYEKFLQCPVQDVSVKDLLYDLALDFERKRMFNKALAVYTHILTDGPFKDVKKRTSRLKPLDSTIALGAAGTRGETSLILDDTKAKPTFGRYEIVRELGHGSMGTVYLGRDPKINRDVAIKTMAYRDVDESELAEVKARFFREAEAAGNLSHPNIVSIYDVGEEHDMAYIALELLRGNDLTVYCKPDNLLPPAQATSVINDVAAALDYAHRQGVVHRDIKPANIMLLEDGRVKVTDFGIARVVDASKTRTGVVLGTPNYMSPEQVAGKTLDGRSDLFSLGVVYYELLAGAKPFKGDTVSAILYAITQQPHMPLSKAAPSTPACCEVIVNKLLTKGVSKRYSSASQVVKALEGCGQML